MNRSKYGGGSPVAQARREERRGRAVDSGMNVREEDLDQGRRGPARVAGLRECRLHTL